MMHLAFIFGSAGVGEWVVLLVVVLIVVGPKRLPEVARKLGRFTETLRRAADEFKRQIMTMDQPSPKPYMQEPAPLPHEAEAEVPAAPAESGEGKAESGEGRAESGEGRAESFSSDADDDGPVNLFAPTAERAPESEARS